MDLFMISTKYNYMSVTYGFCICRDSVLAVFACSKALMLLQPSQQIPPNVEEF